MELKNQYKIILTDLDDTLIQTISGATFPKGIWDMKFKFDILDKIKKLNPEYLFIVTNQGGIGQFVKKDNYENKLNYIISCLKEYIGCKVDGTYCPFTDKNNPMRKPNGGMFYSITSNNGLIPNQDFTNEDCLMIGDASGKPGDFSDSDKMFAENLKIDYIDVDDLLNYEL